MKINLPVNNGVAYVNTGKMPEKITIELSRDEMIQLAVIVGRVSSPEYIAAREIEEAVAGYSIYERRNLMDVEHEYSGEIEWRAPGYNQPK